ncbi:MAG: hypothetical protein U1E36_08480 [Rickettsiales bacterium]
MQPQSTIAPSSSETKAMPKVNVPPTTFGKKVEEIKIEVEKKPIAAEPKKEGFVWDFKFSLGLIMLVIAVNTVLALLLGKSANLADSSAIQVFAEPKGRTIPLTRSPAALQAIAPAAGNAQPQENQPTRTYITPEDKRLLLKYLETPPGKKLPSTTTAQPDTQQ